MTRDAWRRLILAATKNEETLELLARVLEEQDCAMQILREKGYGPGGFGWVETVKAIPDNV